MNKTGTTWGISPPTGTAISRRHQTGFATLAIAAVLLIILSLMSIFLTKSGILDIRTSANKARYSQALANAEYNLEIGLAWLKSNHITGSVDLPTLTGWAPCTNNSIFGSTTGNWQYWMCLNSSQISVASGSRTPAPPSSISFIIATPWVYNSSTAQWSSSPSGTSYTVIASGTSDDGSATVRVRQGTYFYASGSGGNSPPLMGVNNIPLNGNYTVVANPNGGGKGVPISIWSNGTVATPSGSAATCQLGDYNAGTCSANAISNRTIGVGPDIVMNDTSSNFPTDIFQFVTGFSTSQYETVKNDSTVVADCSNLTGLTGKVWVTGTCTLNGTVGSASNPVQLIVQNGAITMNATDTLYGTLFAFCQPVSSSCSNSIQLNGGATVYGSVISNNPNGMGTNLNGAFNVIWNPTVSMAQTTSNQLKTMARTPGGWADYLY